MSRTPGTYAAPLFQQGQQLGVGSSASPLMKRSLSDSSALLDVKLRLIVSSFSFLACPIYKKMENKCFSSPSFRSVNLVISFNLFAGILGIRWARTNRKGSVKRSA